MGLDNFKDATGEISIELPTDEEGYLGLRCPSDDCEKYFKLTPGTGLEEVDEHCCPYCGTRAEPAEFYVKYAESVAVKQLTDALHQDLKSMEFSADAGLFELSLTVESKDSVKIRHYDEEAELGTRVSVSDSEIRKILEHLGAFAEDLVEFVENLGTSP